MESSRPGHDELCVLYFVSKKSFFFIFRYLGAVKSIVLQYVQEVVLPIRRTMRAEVLMLRPATGDGLPTGGCQLLETDCLLVAAPGLYTAHNTADEHIVDKESRFFRLISAASDNFRTEAI